MRMPPELEWSIDRTGRRGNVKNSINKKETKKRLIDSVAILNRAVVTYYMLIRLKGLLILQSARRLVGCESWEPLPYISTRACLLHAKTTGG